MKTVIFITGNGISSKRTLLKKISAKKEQIRELPFNNYAIDFKTKGEAAKALSRAYQDMRADPEYKLDTKYIRGSAIIYGAGRAEIYNPQI